MQVINVYADVRHGRGARSDGYQSPVLPRGWAPLTPEQQAAVLAACDAAPDRVMFRLGSLSELDVDYRVYCLNTEIWAGLCVATRCLDGGQAPTGSNRELLGLGFHVADAVRIALEPFNRDLEAHVEPWRLAVDVPAVPHEGPRRA